MEVPSPSPHSPTPLPDYFPIQDDLRPSWMRSGSGVEVGGRGRGKESGNGSGRGEAEGTSIIKLFLRDVNIAAGGHLGPTQVVPFYYRTFVLSYIRDGAERNI
jgi:hypothetical protein